MHVLGLDAGGTKTVCYLANEASEVLAEARGSGAHLPSAGAQGVHLILREVIDAVLDGQPRKLAAFCLGMAGVDRPSEAAMIRPLVERIVTSPNITIVNDALIALEAGAPGQAGIVLIAGTGSIAYGRDAHGRAARSGGWGYVLADEGSGYWLGRHALRAVMRHADGRGPATSLSARVLEHYQVGRAHELVREVYSGDLKPAAIAALAPIVQMAAEDGDRVAGAIIDTGASELSAAAFAVADRLQLEACPIVLAGGIFRAVPRMREAVTQRLSARLWGSVSRMLEVEPALGAVRLALRVAAGERVVPKYIED